MKIKMAGSVTKIKNVSLQASVLVNDEFHLGNTC